MNVSVFDFFFANGHLVPKGKRYGNDCFGGRKSPRRILRLSRRLSNTQSLHSSRAQDSFEREPAAMDHEMGTGNQNMAVVKGASRVLLLLLPISMSPAAPKVGLWVSILFHNHSTTPSISGVAGVRMLIKSSSLLLRRPHERKSCSVWKNKFRE